MDVTGYTRDYFEKANIHELRTFGRSLNVKSPTNKSKGELIEAIMEALAQNPNGITTDTGKEKKRPGRPPKDMTLCGNTILKTLAQNTVEEPTKEEEGVKILDGISEDLTDAFSNKPTPTETVNRPKPRYKNNYNNNGNGYNKYRNNNSGNPTNSNNNYNNGNNYKPSVANNSQSNNNNSNTNGDDAAPNEGAIEIKEGVLEILPDGYGFLRAHNYDDGGEKDAYVAAQKIKKSGLRKGDWVKAETRKICENRPAGVVNVLEVNGRAPDSAFGRKNFDALTPVYPNERFRLELPKEINDFAIRAIDVVSPIGKGQRAMIVSPPKAGKTTLLKKIAHSISTNYPKAHLMVLLIDERPEEVTDMKRSIQGEVVYSTFDEMPEHHTKAAELVLERAKRLVELGEDVVILMDSLTRLARAYNLTIAPTGRTLSGGIDPGALHSPKRFFGAARNIEFGGSLTIIATALVDTGSRMDDVIYEEFKGTGNMEIHLDRKLSEKRIFPAIDINRSGTRREELLLDQFELEGIWAMRKMLSVGESAEATENLINMLIRTKTNYEFLEQLNLQVKALQKQGFSLK